MRIALILCLLFAVGSVDQIDLNLQKNEVAFTFFDLPDGEAALMQSQAGNVLINTGSEESRKALFKRLAIYGVKKIDKLLITNSGDAYTGNILDVIHKYHVKSLLTTKTIFQSLKMNLVKPHIIIMKEGEQGSWLPEVKTVVLRESIIQNKQAAAVMRFRHGNESILYMGWTDPKMENSLMNDSRIDCNVVKIADFASEDHPVSSFFRKVNPQVAIIFHRKGKLPDKKILEDLDAHWIDVYRTHQVGSVTIKFTPRSYQITTIPIQENIA